MAKIKKKASRTKRNTQEDIKSIAHGISDVYHAYRKQFNIVLLAAAVIVAATLLFSLVKSGQEKSAGSLFETAYASFRAAEDSGSNYEQALQGFQEVVKEYGGTMNGAIAQFYIGNTFLKMGRPDDALKAYEDFIKRYNGEKFILGLVYQRMGYVNASLGKTEEAITSFQQAEVISGAGVATLELAHLYDRMGKTSEALAKYKELTEKLPGSTWSMEAKSKLPPPDLSALKTGPGNTARK